MSKSTPVVRRAGDFDCIPRGCRYWTAESNNAGRTEKEIQTRRRLFLITRLSSRQFDSPASFVSSKISDGQSSIKDGHLFHDGHRSNSGSNDKMTFEPSFIPTWKRTELVWRRRRRRRRRWKRRRRRRRRRGRRLALRSEGGGAEDVERVGREQFDAVRQQPQSGELDRRTRRRRRRRRFFRRRFRRRRRRPRRFLCGAAGEEKKTKNTNHVLQGFCEYCYQNV